MALPTELAMRLQSGEPLSKRLKLAANVYHSTDLVISGKQDIIVRWLCKAAPTDAEVWKNLSLCMNYKRCDNRDSFLHETKRILVDTIVDELKLRHKDVSDDVLNTCNELLATIDMQQYLQMNVGKLFSLIRELFLRIKSDDCDRLCQRISNRQKYILNAIESLVHMYKQSSEKDDLAMKFLEHVFSPLCALVDPTCKDSSNRIGAEAHKCIQQILFGKARYKEYKDYSKGSGEGQLPKKVLDTVSHLTKETDSDHLEVTLSYLFGAAVGSYKFDSLLVDSLFRSLVDAAGSFQSAVFNSLVEYLADVPLDYDNKISDISLTKYFENLVDQTIVQKNFSNVEYDLLFNISRLNPLVIENKLSNILERILVKKKETESEKRFYVKLMIGILNASAKLRRQPKLIPSILRALESALGQNEDCHLTAGDILPNEFCAEFTKFISALKTPQIIAVTWSLKYHLKSNCVDEIRTGSENRVCLMTECIESLITSFINGIRVYEYTVPLALQQKFVGALGELGELLSELSGEILSNTKDGRLLPALFQMTLSWIKLKSLLVSYAPEAGAGCKADPINENHLRQLIRVVENFEEKRYKNSLNNFLLYRIKLDLNNHKSQEKLTGLIGGLEDSWRIIAQSYPELILLLDLNQLSELASLILKDVVGRKNGLEKWRDVIERDIFQENEKFSVAILCHALKVIGTVVRDSTYAHIVSRINLIRILETCTEDSDVPVLNRTKPITEIVQLSDLNKHDSSKIQKCLQIMLCLPLSWLPAPLRTMLFVTIYVIARELKSDDEIGNLCDRILNDIVEEGAINILDFVDMTLLMSHLPGNKVLQKVFNTSLRLVSEPASSSQHLTRLSSCPEQAVPAVLSCMEIVKSKLNNEQKRTLDKVEKKLVKESLGKVEENPKSVKTIRSITFALKSASRRNTKIKSKLKQSTKDALFSIFLDHQEVDGEDSGNENQNPDNNNELIKQGFELATIALKLRSRLEISEELVASIWAMILEHSETKLLPLLLESTAPQLLKRILSSLQMEMEKHLRANDIIRLNNTLSIWNFIIESNMGPAKTKSRLGAIRSLLLMLQTDEISPESWQYLTKLLLTIINTGHLRLPSDFIDLIILTALKPLTAGNLAVYDHVLRLCLALIRVKLEVMCDRLPLLLQLYGKAVGLIIHEAEIGDVTNNQQFSLCIHNVEKVSGALVKLRRDLVRICPHIIADLVTMLGDSDLQPATKEVFKNCIYNLRSICDPHGINLLSRGLPLAKREIFKDLNETYKRYHRFTGKI